MGSAASVRDQVALAGFSERLQESDMFHAGLGKVRQTLEALVRQLEAAEIPYAIIGGMAVNAHGYARETVDVDVLLTPEGLDAFTSQFVGKGYRPAFEGARKTFIDTQTKVTIDIVTTGDYPGDGRPKPVAFPDPAKVTLLTEAGRVINLPELLNLKLASGQSAPGRLRDLADVQDLIRILQLDEAFAEQLHPYVRETYKGLLRGLSNSA